MSASLEENESVRDPLMDSKTAASIDTIRRWIEGNRPSYVRQDDNFILRFLRVCQFDVEATKKRISRFYELRQSNREWFELTTENQELFEDFSKNHIGYIIVPENSQDETVCVLKPGSIDLKKHRLDKLLAFVTFLIELYIDEPNFNTMELHVILDYKGIDISYVTQLTPRFFWRSNNLQSIMPLRYAHFHVVNASTYLYTIFGMFRLFLTKSLSEKMVYHEGDFKSFEGYIKPEQLPLEYGGSAGPEQRFIDVGTQRARCGNESSSRSSH